jgi:hypothetical protein
MHSRLQQFMRPVPAIYLCLAIAFVTASFGGRRSLESGNRLFRAGEPRRAADVYTNRTGDTARGRLASYNLGTALAAVGEPEAERHLLGATQATDAEVARKAHYNLGVVLLEQVDVEGDPYPAMLLLTEAIRHNRAALRLEPTDSLAGWNLAIALRMHQQLAQVIEEAPVDEPEGEAEIAEDEDQPPGEAAAGGAGEEGEAPPQDDTGDPEGPRTGAAEALAGSDPGALSEDAVRQMLESQVDDTEQLIRGLLWSQRPSTRAADAPRTSSPGGW